MHLYMFGRYLPNIGPKLTWHANEMWIPEFWFYWNSFFPCCDLAHPVPINSAPRASQAKKRQTLLCAAAGDAIYAIGLQFSIRKNYKIEEPWLERPWRTRCFLRFEHLGLFLDVLGFACLNNVKKTSYLPCLHSNCQPLAWKRPLYDYENNTKWSLLFTFRFWYLLTVFGL